VHTLLIDVRHTGSPSPTIDSTDVDLSHATGLSQALIRLAAKPAIDVIVLDLDLAVLYSERLELFERVIEAAPETPIVILTDADDFNLALDYVRRGAQDYLIKGESNNRSNLHRIYVAVERKRVELMLRQGVEKSKIELERLVQERTEKLTQSNEELRQFAKIASHDLQEPLRAVEGFANLLAETTKGKLDQNCEEFVEYIVDGVKRMQHLIRSVLVHSQITNQGSTKHVTDCNQVLNEILVDMRATILETKTAITMTGLPRVAVEHSQLSQLFQNLISNSIKYRGVESPQIFITAERILNKWHFSFRDNGIGIDSQYSDKIFDMFSRLHAKTKYPGTGMGLAICKRIVTSHGGTIWVESKLDQGSIFMFTLPAVGDTRRKNMKEAIEILLVEDTPSDVRLTQEALRRSNLNYELLVVNDGVEATDHLFKLKELGSKLPDIILLDLNMPRKNGHEVLNEIKNDVVLRQIPVILLTVSEREEDVQEALKQRMNYYVAKPVNTDKLSSLIRSIHDLQTKAMDTQAVYTEQETHMRLVLAGNPHTSIVALTKLASDPNDRVRSRVAENPGIVPAIIEKLAQDVSAEVRSSVSENPNTPKFVLAMLAKDPNEDVRMNLSTNPHIPKDVLVELSGDENIFVATAARDSLAARSD
jgi:signal transduction histidine kinase